MFGKIAHLGFDALLVAALLAGIKRTTGLTPKLSSIRNKDVRNIFSSYLEIGEYAFDMAVVVLGRSDSFERRR